MPKFVEASIKSPETLLKNLSVSEPSPERQFKPEKNICDHDRIVIEMLSTEDHKDECFVVCDPELPDIPIIFASDGFCKFTGYSAEEIEGRNCRFLQGPETSRDAIRQIKEAIVKEEDASVNLLNYRKDGSIFYNEFFISPLYDDDGKLVYFIGVQAAVPTLGPGQEAANPGWVCKHGDGQ